MRYATGRPGWARTARTCEWFGIASLPVAILSAVIDTRGIGFLIEPKWDGPLIWHAIAGIAATMVFAAHAVWSRRLGDERPPLATGLVDLGGVTVAFALVVLTGHLGAQMVFAA